MAEIIVNHATVRQRADMLTFIRLCAERGLHTISIWGDEIDKVGEASAIAALRANEMEVSGYNRLGPLTSEYLRRADAELERAARFGARYAFVFTGGLTGEDRDMPSARRRLEDQIGALLIKARSIGVTLALEPLHPMLLGERTLIASLSHANNLCDMLGHGIGLVVDTYHVWWDEHLEAEVMRAGKAGRLLGFHVNDWLVPTRHLLTDRGMMGDGIIDLKAIEALLRRAGYTGPIEVEIFSTDWWAREPTSVLDLALARCRQIFGEQSE